MYFGKGKVFLRALISSLLIMGAVINAAISGNDEHSHVPLMYHLIFRFKTIEFFLSDKTAPC
jgi:hypothetical protein